MPKPSKLKYRSGYKYQVYETYKFYIGHRISVDEAVGAKFLHLGTNGTLIIDDGYAWDGPSGPAIDTKNFMRGSLCHDAIYQLMRKGLLPNSRREAADLIMNDINKEDGMCRIRRWWILRSVRKFANESSLPKNQRIIHEAP